MITTEIIKISIDYIIILIRRSLNILKGFDEVIPHINSRRKLYITIMYPKLINLKEYQRYRVYKVSKVKENFMFPTISKTTRFILMKFCYVHAIFLSTLTVCIFKTKPFWTHMKLLS